MGSVRPVLGIAGAILWALSVGMVRAEEVPYCAYMDSQEAIHVVAVAKRKAQRSGDKTKNNASVIRPGYVKASTFQAFMRRKSPCVYWMAVKQDFMDMSDVVSTHDNLCVFEGTQSEGTTLERFGCFLGAYSTDEASYRPAYPDEDFGFSPGRCSPSALASLTNAWYLEHQVGYVLMGPALALQNIQVIYGGHGNVKRFHSALQVLACEAVKSKVTRAMLGCPGVGEGVWNRHGVERTSNPEVKSEKAE